MACNRTMSSMLSKRIIVQSYNAGTKDALGGHSARSWSDSFSAWAEVKPISGREILENLRENETVTFKITMRYYPGKTLLDATDRNKWRIKYGTRFFSIKSVINKDESDNIIEVYCKEDTVGEDGNAKS